MSALSQWLQLMLAEITRKQEDLERARVEADRRAREQAQEQQWPTRRCAAHRARVSLSTGAPEANRRPGCLC